MHVQQDGTSRSAGTVSVEVRTAETFNGDRPTTQAETLDCGRETNRTDPREVECDRTGHVQWCCCESCEVMMRPVDCLCCRESAPAMVKLPPGVRCIADHPDFDTVCLHREVLRVCPVAYREFRGETDADSHR